MKELAASWHMSGFSALCTHTFACLSTTSKTPLGFIEAILHLPLSPFKGSLPKPMFTVPFASPHLQMIGANGLSGRMWKKKKWCLLTEMMSSGHYRKNGTLKHKSNKLLSTFYANVIIGKNQLIPKTTKPILNQLLLGLYFALLECYSNIFKVSEAG